MHGDVDREIDRAADNFLRAPAEVLDLGGNKLSALKRQRDHLLDELHVVECAGKPRDIGRDVDALVGNLWRLGEEIAKADPARKREVFRQMVDRIELRFDHIKQGKKTACPLRSGVFYLRTGEGTIFGSVSRGDWI
ncbi:MAG TPA: hypothetical protein VFB96_05700 [Pirellulaceae bacterium]|nr:hypothetical protein [Pirellulaceae bacterium]